MLSASEDGRLIATGVGSWKTVNVWKTPHGGKAVLNVCLHPSDKFALSLGKDGSLRGWDMFKGRQIEQFKTADITDERVTLDNLALSPDGNTFALSGGKLVTLISLVGEDVRDDDTLTVDSRVTSMCWLDNENLLIGLENGSIEWLQRNERSNDRVSFSPSSIIYTHSFGLSFVLGESTKHSQQKNQSYASPERICWDNLQ